jgi:hypothetical protein
MPAKRKAISFDSSTALAGFESNLWVGAGTFRNAQHIDRRSHRPSAAVTCADYVLPKGCISCNRSGEGDICRALIESDLLDCMLLLPGRFIYNKPISIWLWFIKKTKVAVANHGLRD